MRGYPATVTAQDPVLATARAFDARELGTLDDAEPLYEGDLPELYGRQVALTRQRIRVLSAQLARAYDEHGEKALVRETFIYDRETGEAVSSGEQITGLAELEGRERDRLDRQIALHLKLAVIAEEAAGERRKRSQALARLAEEICRAAGLDWAAAETREIARRAVAAAFAAV